METKGGPEGASSRFSVIYDTLSPSEQRALLNTHLLPLLDRMSSDNSLKIISAATRAKSRILSIPVLDLERKKAEMMALQAELERHERRGPHHEQSEQTEIVNEIVRSLTEWLGDIWCVVYEHKTEFKKAHACLFLCALVLEDLSRPHGSCQCSFNDMHISVRIRRQTGSTVRHFRLIGVPNINRILFWIWRDMFLTMLASNDPYYKNDIPKMLDEIKHATNWHSLERVLIGGRRSFEEEDEDEDIDTDSWVTENGDSMGDDDSHSNTEQCPSPFHALHWTPKIKEQLALLRGHITQSLIDVFTIVPSIDLYSTILTVDNFDPKSERKLDKLLIDMMNTGADAMSTALAVYVWRSDVDHIITLLDESSHLLRPRDAPTLQIVTILLGSKTKYLTRAIQILESELFATVLAIQNAIRTAFPKIEDTVNRQDIQAIITLPVGSDTRQQRIELWVDRISSADNDLPDPFAFAAAMIGLPIGNPNAPLDPSEPALEFPPDMDLNDPEFEALKEQHRPRLKSRLEGWIKTAESMRVGREKLFQLYTDLVTRMPYLRVHEAIQEMISRMEDRHSKHHVCDSLDALSTFVKAQRQKHKAALEKQKKKMAKSAASSSIRTLRGAQMTKSNDGPSTESLKASPAMTTVPPGNCDHSGPATALFVPSISHLASQVPMQQPLPAQTSPIFGPPPPPIFSPAIPPVLSSPPAPPTFGPPLPPMPPVPMNATTGPFPLQAQPTTADIVPFLANISEPQG